MDQSGQQDREIGELRERLSRLSDASRRINESLDFDTVLQEVLDSARSLTGGRYGVMTLTGDSGQIEDFLSSGMTGEETERLWQLPQGPQLIGYLGSILEPLRVRDLVGHLTSMGLPAFDPPLPVGPEVPFLAAPIVQRGANVGNIFVFDTDDGAEFSRDDEETLVMFASQAAMVIGNARTYRDERRARTDLETLVNTSPVGVVVFDVKTGAPVLRNREMERFVDHLREPDQPPEQLLDVLTFVRGDGREISLKELPIAELLRIHEVIRVEEITLRAPNGRSVSALLNATPILSDDGEIETFVVTLQDMTPLEDLERLRAEFLGMVSHELRAPLTSIKGSVTTLLESASELDPAEMTQFFRIIRDQSDQMRYLIGDLLDVARIETGTLSVTPEHSDVSLMVDEARNRFLSGGGRSDLRIDVEADLPPVMADRRRIIQVLSNLLSNAARYLARGLADPDPGRTGGRRCHDLRRRRGSRHPRRPPAAPLQEVLPQHGRGPGKWRRRVGPGTRDLQGHRGGARGPHLGGERRAGPGGAVHLHDSGCGGGPSSNCKSVASPTWKAAF
ncbi:MAG: GAF domain-containing protein, partial [Gammaproteobacteria bacterium]|nr:GAF domain-containing protein [Gammaproteobacteria bacterium]